MNNLALMYRSFGAPEVCLKLEAAPLDVPPDGRLRVAMRQTPINPSDLIPITGAYAHRTTLPAIAGYEGVGRVISAPSNNAELIGRRVLPLRGVGTWQAYVDCDPELAIPVPEGVNDDVAARAYINPLAASRMLARWGVYGKRVLLSGAGSMCADLLGHWAHLNGAEEVVGIYRSTNRVERMRALGIIPVSAADEDETLRRARATDLTFDSLGGPLASLILDNMRTGTSFIGYGLLTGQAIRPSRPPLAAFERFHLRDDVTSMRSQDWQLAFHRIWPKLRAFTLPAVRFYPMSEWRAAIRQTRRPGGAKPILCFGS